MRAENTILIQCLRAVLGVLLVTYFCGCKTPQAITPDSSVAKHDQEMPPANIYTNYSSPKVIASIHTNYPSPSALLWSPDYRNCLGYRNYLIYLEQDDSERDFWEGIGGLLQWCEPILVYYAAP